MSDFVELCDIQKIIVYFFLFLSKRGNLIEMLTRTQQKLMRRLSVLTQPLKTISQNSKIHFFGASRMGYVGAAGPKPRPGTSSPDPFFASRL